MPSRLPDALDKAHREGITHRDPEARQHHAREPTHTEANSVRQLERE